MSNKQLHKMARKAFRQGVFERDGHKCKKCKSKGELDAHHITDRHEMPNGGYTIYNGISLCPDCHIEAEQWHISDGKYAPDGFNPTDLYNMINSSYDIAYTASVNLYGT